MVISVAGSAAHAAVDGVGGGAQAGGHGAEEDVGFGEDLFVAPFGFFLPVDFAVVDLADVVPDFGDEVGFLARVEAAESIRHDLRVAAFGLLPCS